MYTLSQQMGGQRYEDVEKTKVECTVLPGIECYGDRKFLRDGFPCVKYRCLILNVPISNAKQLVFPFIGIQAIISRPL